MARKGFSDVFFWILIGLLVIGAMLGIIFYLNASNSKILDVIRGVTG